MPLNDLQIRFAKPRGKPFKLTDGGGLHLLVQPSGSKLWRLKYRFAGKEKLLSFGSYPEVGLAVARHKRAAARAMLVEGVDPGAARGEEPAQHPETFEAIARLWHANRADGLNEAHAKRVFARLRRDAFPRIGRRAIGDISAPDILAIIRKVEARGALDVSRRLKQCVSQIFRFAIANGWAKDDPTVHLAGALKPRPRVRHMSKVPLTELPQLVNAIRNYDGDATPERREMTQKALMFTLLTWARTSEVRFAVWSEFEGLEGDQPLWRIPPERMKMKREHLVPLSRQAADLLRMLRITSTNVFVFPGDQPRKPISENTMIYGCYRMGYRGRQTVHGFRGLGSTWANEAELYKSEWVEMALAHSDKDEIRGAYNSALYLAARRRMLQHWADHLDNRPTTAQPPPVRRAAALHGEAVSNRGKSLATKHVPSVSQCFWRRSAIAGRGFDPRADSGRLRPSGGVADE